MLLNAMNPTRARHRAPGRPSTAFTSFGQALPGKAVRRGALAAATTGLAITMATTSASAMESPSGPQQEAARSSQATSANTHTVQAGETVAELAQNHGSTTGAIIEDNDLGSDALIHVGQVLQIPATGTDTPTSAEHAHRSDDAASRDGGRTDTTPVSAADPGAVVNIAYRYIGTPYVWGGSTPAGFDCSGFTQYVYEQVGISIPRSSAAQRYAGTEIPASEARPGDLIWWPGHVGIYVGDGQYIAAFRPGEPLSVRDIYKANPTFIRVS